MTKKSVAVRMIVWAIAALLVSGCSNRRSSGGPGGTGPTPGGGGGNTSQCAPVGVAINSKAIDGTEISRMRVELMRLSPGCGATIRLNTNCIDGGCFEGSIRYHYDGIDNPNVPMRVQAFWSKDGINPIGGSWESIVVTSGNSMTRNYGPWRFDMVPSYILIKLEHVASGTDYKDPAEEGYVALGTDWR